jgi:CARDB
MALWVDDLNTIKETKENDNTSLSDGTINISNRLPDINVQTWYADPYDYNGNYQLTYQVNNSGGTETPKNFSISLVLSDTQNLGDGSQWWLFNEYYPNKLPVGYMTYRDSNNPAYFNLYHDVNNASIPEGYYYMAFWVDFNNKVLEADESNNASFAQGLIDTYQSTVGLRKKALSKNTEETSATSNIINKHKGIFNGKKLPPANMQMRKVKISQTATGGRKIEFLDSKANIPTKQALHEKVYNKTLISSDSVIFPTQHSTPMP